MLRAHPARVEGMRSSAGSCPPPDRDWQFRLCISLHAWLGPHPSLYLLCCQPCKRHSFSVPPMTTLSTSRDQKLPLELSQSPITGHIQLAAHEMTLLWSGQTRRGCSTHPRDARDISSSSFLRVLDLNSSCSPLTCSSCLLSDAARCTSRIDPVFNGLSANRGLPLSGHQAVPLLAG